MKNLGTYVLIAFLFTIIGIVGGFRLKEPILAKCASVATKAAVAMNYDIRQIPSGSTRLTSPLLECAELPQSISDATLDDVKNSVQSIISKAQTSSDISYASVYYRDLNNGPWFGINESEKYFPASLLKLPLAMSFYDKSEDDPSILSHQITYKPDPSVTAQAQPFGVQDELQAGKKYTVQELLDTMLKESNNEAANALALYGGTPMIDRVYQNLGLTLPQAGQDYSINTHRYASFFRILYNATFLDRVASEKILKTLTDSAFDGGLIAGVPKETTVSHKFGTRQVDAGGTVQLHDCGIVYAGKKPYILCVMTQGKDFTKLAGVIKNISATVYQSVIRESQ